MKNVKLFVVAILVTSVMMAACGNGETKTGTNGSVSTEISSSLTSTKESTVSETSTSDSLAPAEETSTSKSDEPVQKNFQFTRENFPKFDGSTSLRPLGVGIASLLLGESRESVDELFDFHMTDAAYYYMASGNADILIAAQACDSVLKHLEEQNFEYDIEPIAMEGLVFVVNEKNPVDSLTIGQIKDIYTGKITNWSQVGGENIDIVAFQRTETSGSQVMMRKCVMTDQELMEAPTELMPGTMGGLIDGVAAYDNSASAIGYTVYYYADSMKMADGLKIIKVDGIEPCNETIGSGQYPFTNPYFCIVSKKSEENSPERILYNWLVSQDGQKLVELEGYVPVNK